MVLFCRLRAFIAAGSPRKFVRRTSRALLVACICIAGAANAFADNGRFDLTGPKIEVHVTRAGVTLPIASVPNLQPGDRLWLHPDLPPTQSVHYLMVLAFLRGTTNPPPDKWFIRIETWDKKVRREGVEVTVPEEAQQAVLFLAPVTGGDFSTLRSAVQGRPGIFVRASQDLSAAGFEQARIEKYIASMRDLSPAEAADPKQLQEHSNLIASTLALKPNGDCIRLAPEQQYTCLTQSGSQTLLDDGHGQSIVDALTSGTSAGLIGTVSSTQLMGGGLYSAYVGSIVDLVHIMGSLHTAQYQYIPAIAFPDQQSLNLRLNTPPSFHNPKSVIVIGLPSIQKTVPPPLRAANPNDVSCLQKPGVVLHVEGAPLVFSTAFAHDLVLHLNYPAGTKPGPSAPEDIPLTADAFRGGLVLAPPEKRRALAAERIQSASAESKSKPGASNAGSELTGTIQGYWGFEPFTGPTMPLQQTPGKDWKLVEGSSGDWLIAGKDRHIQITSTGTACVDTIALEAPKAQPEKATWKPAEEPNTLDVSLDIPSRESLQLAIRQFGDSKPATLKLVSYSEPAKLDGLVYHAGDATAVLTGTSLDEVKQVELGGLVFKPSEERSQPVSQQNGKPGLLLTAASAAKVQKLSTGSKVNAKVALNDGRTLHVSTTVQPPRPSVILIGRSLVPEPQQTQTPLIIHLSSESDLPVADSLMFSLKSAQPFPRDGSIEVASTDGSLHTSLTVANGSLVLADPQTLMGTLQPLKAFGPSAFGPIRLRAVAADGTAGEWLPLASLVRLPALSELSCPVATPASSPAEPTPPTESKTPSASDTPADSSSTPASTTSDPSAPWEPQGVATPADAQPSTATDAASAVESKSSGPDTSPAAVSDGSGTQASAAPQQPPAPKPQATCTLSGSRLYLIDSVATKSDFADAVHIPEGFVGSSISVPAPGGAALYLRLRDDPSAADTVSLPAGPLSPQN